MLVATRLRQDGAQTGFTVYVVVFAVVALALAPWWPARRAAKVDPTVAWRCE